ncbi:hypothetical protein VNO77_13196 [Canavalia gladiata]|uniref:CASP-like protein n=1 Tax=Canavalia gladiata TaxID=3824 RepID=A0AAN9M1L7_CANGL
MYSPYSLIQGFEVDKSIQDCDMVLLCGVAPPISLLFLFYTVLEFKWMLKMKDFPGTPGTVLGLALRMSQFIFAAGSIASMATTPSFFNFTAFCYLIASMGLQVIWSVVLALLDAYALVRKKVLHNAVLVSLFLVGDWVTAILSLAAASSSAGIIVLYFNDLGHCHFGEECQKYQISVALAFLSWIPISISSLIMLWLLAAG